MDEKDLQKILDTIEEGRTKDKEEFEQKLESVKEELKQPVEKKIEHKVELIEDEADKQPGFETIGEMAIAVYKHASNQGTDQRLIRAQEKATGLGESIPSEGGFLVDQPLVAGILERMWQTGVLAGRTSRMPIGPGQNGVKLNAVDETSRADGSRWGGVLAYWAAEAAVKTASKPKFRQMELNLKKLIGLCYSTDELLQDSVALTSHISSVFPKEFGFKIDDALVNGLGAGQPLGILNSGCLVTVSKEAGQAAATFISENVYKMYSRMWAPSLGNAVWFINQTVWPQIFQLHQAVGTGGVPMFVPAGGISAAPFGTLMGRPIIPIEQCQALGTLGDIIFADYGEYQMIEKGGIQSAVSIHVQFVYDETVFRFVYRVDGQPKWTSALTPYKGGAGATQSPFVVLETRS